ncbi:MAG: hypothetical protein IJ308_06660 [Clostridia bacterium]|nr:hypothetical protein [Clostridia bacterium]
MKRNRLALVAVLFLTAVTLVFVSVYALQKQSPSSVTKTRNIERIFTPRPRIKP